MVSFQSKSLQKKKGTVEADLQQAEEGLRAAETQGMRRALAYWIQLRRQLDLQGFVGHTYPRLGLK